MLQKAGLPETTRYHDLRHGTASYLISQGVPIPIVSGVLGHANSAITMRYYAHVLEGQDSIAASAMDDLLADNEDGL